METYRLMRDCWSLRGCEVTTLMFVVATQYVYAGCAYVTKRTCDSSHVKVTTVISAQIMVEEVLGVAGNSA